MPLSAHPAISTCSSGPICGSATPRLLARAFAMNVSQEVGEPHRKLAYAVACSAHECICAFLPPHPRVVCSMLKRAAYFVSLQPVALWRESESWRESATATQAALIATHYRRAEGRRERERQRRFSENGHTGLFVKSDPRSATPPYPPRQCLDE